MMVWIGCVFTGFGESGLYYITIFHPRGIPYALLPFLIAAEMLSYIFRCVSLALRLFANIVAGHILLDTLALFIHKTIYPSTFTFSSLLIALVPFIMCIVLLLFECVVAILQGYIFVVLTCLYLKDSFAAKSHH